MHVAASTGRVVAGRYLLEKPIGRGAMGTVWRARDSVLARDVAVKEVRLRGPVMPGSVTPGSVRAEETRVLYERTLREARTAARLNHPAVVTVYDVIEADGSPWIVMELVQARSLERVLAEDGPLLPHQAADLGTRLLSALACAHAAGILHRDVKPSNVLLGSDGRAVLTDFGIATLEGDPGLTLVGMVMGTPGFTAPERVRGDAASPASDLWSLGATLYAAVEGRGPFDDRGTSMAILAAIANEHAPRPRSAGPLRAAIEALLRRDPRARPDATAAGELLLAAQQGGSQAVAQPAGQSGQPPPLTVPDQLDEVPWAPDRLDVEAGEPPWAQQWLDGEAGSPPLSVDRVPVDRADGADMHLVPLADGQDWAADEFPSPTQRFASPSAGRRHAATSPGRPGGLLAGLGGLLAGRGTLLPSGRRGLLAGLGAAAVLGAGILGGVAWSHGSAAAQSGGSRSYSVSATEAGSAAGFTMAVPVGWHEARRGPSTDFTSPAGGLSIQVTPTASGAVGAPGEALRLQAQALRHGGFPGYQQVALRPFRFRGGLGVAWEFTWQPSQGGRAEVLDVAFRLTTTAGPQAYLLRESAPAATWTASQPVFSAALRTFRPQS
ncbi:MAG TPA: serine/threonine-protein kinase [Streptosporangiaceae bacterium]|nr:serine/threonine-protein kinase [Streptosporangiaceae bacterium]